MKLFSFLKTTLIIVVCCSLFLIIAGFCYTYAYSHYDKGEQAAVINSYSVVQDNIYSDSELEADVLTVLSDFTSSLSPNIVKVLSRDWKIIVASELPEVVHAQVTFAPNMKIDGYTSWHTRTIFIEKSEDIDKVLSVFAHELGHCFDYEFGTISSTEEFKGVYLSYKDVFVENNSFSTQEYLSHSEAEFFATLFKEYLLYPENLRSQAPEAFTFVDGIYNEVSSNDSADTTLKYDLQSAILRLLEGFKSLQSDE